MNEISEESDEEENLLDLFQLTMDVKQLKLAKKTDLNAIKSLRRKKKKANKRAKVRKNKENYYSELDLEWKNNKNMSNEDKYKKVRFADEEPDGRLEDVSIFAKNQIVSAPLKSIEPTNKIIEKQPIGNFLFPKFWTEHDEGIVTYFSKRLNELVWNEWILNKQLDSSDLTSLGALENYLGSSLESMKANNEAKKMRAVTIINSLKAFKEQSLQSIQVWKDEIIKIISEEEIKFTTKINDIVKQKQSIFEESVKFLNDFDSSKVKVIYKSPAEFHEFNQAYEIINFMHQISDWKDICGNYNTILL